MSEHYFSEFARDIGHDRYHWLGEDGSRETWPEVADRVARNVMCAVGASWSLYEEVRDSISAKKLMPGGRYLAASGREMHQTQNCLLLRPDDTREGWATHLSQATLALMTGAGIGADYSDVREEGAPLKRSMVWAVLSGGPNQPIRRQPCSAR